jgi:hypothetical protein
MSPVNSLGEFRSITKDLPDDTDLVIMSTQDGDAYAIDDVSVNRDVNVIIIETSLTNGQPVEDITLADEWT